MSVLRTAIVKPLRRTFTPAISARSLSTTPTFLSKTPPPPGNIPPNSQAVGRTSHVADDPQSSASTKGESKSGDDHPAKQPDPQPESDRSTGFQEVKGGVKGGKEGLDQRSDK